MRLFLAILYFIAMNKMKILHITAHLGGGVGKAVIGMALGSRDYAETKIIMLEKPEKTRALEDGEKSGVAIYVCPDIELCLQLMEEADIVVINWWNHPLMAKFLYEMPQIDCRLVAWVHVNGCTYPYLPYAFLERFDYVFFTSRYSYENALWSEKEAKQLFSKSAVILGNGAFLPEKLPQKTVYEKREVFRLGYVGTLNYSKINRNYVQYCEEAIRVCPNLRVVLVGDVGEDLKHDIEKSSYSNCFELVGYKEDVEEYFLSFDALGYILNADNYGTTENVILEAMAYGIPVVLHDGGVERTIIDNNENGFLVQDSEEFAQCIKTMQNDTMLRYKVGSAAREKVCKEFSSIINCKNYEKHCTYIYSLRKKKHNFSDLLGESPTEWFLFFTGRDRVIFENYLEAPGQLTGNQLRACKPIYKGERKSSVKHFLNYFPEELQLKKLAREIEEGKKDGGTI